MDLLVQELLDAALGEIAAQTDPDALRAFSRDIITALDELRDMVDRYPENLLPRLRPGLTATAAQNWILNATTFLCRTTEDRHHLLVCGCEGRLGHTVFADPERARVVLGYRSRR